MDEIGTHHRFKDQRGKQGEEPQQCFFQEESEDRKQCDRVDPKEVHCLVDNTLARSYQGAGEESKRCAFGNFGTSALFSRSCP
ncbi:hypothetical protein TNCV_3614051 [Trichonephila clavipes]|uniref:Uncharacterized protein n=1 Tax=Trichonephila clavipes TaxID=2585209 RepID=A0A8X6SIX8_TRICX|nr:hypothetical protein TNCV_3614051 [Trichonephila clavipes]